MTAGPTEARPRLTSASDDGTIQRWNPTTGTPIGQPLTGHTGPINALAVNRTGLTLASAGQDGTVRLWDLAAQPVTSEALATDVALNTVTFSASDAFVEAGGQSDVRFRWEIRFGRRELVSSAASMLVGGINDIAYIDEQGSSAIATADDAIVVRQRPPAGGESGSVGHIRTEAHGGAILCLGVSSEPGRLASGGVSGVVIVWAIG